MPHPLKTLLDRRGRSAAANINATFVAYGNADYCTVTLRDTGVTVLAKLAVSAQMTPGQEVIVSRPDGSGRSANTNYTVIALAGASAPGSSPAVTQAQNHPGATITSIDPDPCVIVAGHDIDIVIKGRGFTTVPSYQLARLFGHGSITEYDDAEITDDQIVLHVRVAVDVPPGDYVLTIGTLKTDPTYFRVTENLLRSFVVDLPSSVIQGTPFDFTVTAKDGVGAVLTTYGGTVHFTSDDGVADLPMDYTFTPADAGERTFVATLNTAGTKSIAAHDGVIEDDDSTDVTATSSLWALVEDVHGSGYAHLLRIEPSDLSVIHDYTFSAADYDVCDLAAVDGIVYARSGASMLRVDASSGTVQGEDGSLYGSGLQQGEMGVGDGALVYPGGTGDTSVIVYDESAHTETLIVIESGGPGVNGVSIDVGDPDIAWCIESGFDLVKVQVSTTTELDRVSVPQGTGAIQAIRVTNDTDYVYVGRQAYGGQDGGIVKIDKSDLSIVGTTATSFPNFDNLGYLEQIDGELWATGADLDGNNFFRIHPSLDGDGVAISVSGGLRGFAERDGTFYVADDSGGITPVDATTLTVGTTVSVTSTPIHRLIAA